MKRFNISEMAIDKVAGEVVQVSKVMQKGNVLVLHEVYEPDWDGNEYHLRRKVVKGYNLMRFTKQNLIKFLQLTDFEIGLIF